MQIHPGCGFNKCEYVTPLDISFPAVTPCLLTLRPGDVVTCLGKARIFDATRKIHFEDNAIICRWPQLMDSMPWNAFHLFSGGYMGWSRALIWLGKKEANCAISQQISVDADSTAMDCWKQTFGRDCLIAPVDADTPWQASQNIGVCADVADQTIARLGVFQNNAISTMSPPCIAWRKKPGLEHRSWFRLCRCDQSCWTFSTNYRVCRMFW